MAYPWKTKDMEGKRFEFQCFRGTIYSPNLIGGKKVSAGNVCCMSNRKIPLSLVICKHMIFNHYFISHVV